MKKILLLSILVLLFTGCKVEYKLTIEDDLQVTESVNMTGTDALFDIYYKSSRLNVINMLFDDYAKDMLQKNNYQYEIIEEKTPYVLATKKYDNIKSFTNDTIFYKQYFNSLEYSEKDGVVTIETKDFMPNDPDNPGRYNISDLRISIESKYKVLEHNATSMDESTNTYYWDIKADTNDFKLLLKVDSNTKFDPYTNMYIAIIISVLIIIITWITVWQLEKREKKNKKKKNS